MHQQYSSNIFLDKEEQRFCTGTIYSWDTIMFKSYIFKSENAISAMACKYPFTISWPLNDYIYLVKITKTSNKYILLVIVPDDSALLLSRVCFYTLQFWSWSCDCFIVKYALMATQYFILLLNYMFLL